MTDTEQYTFKESSAVSIISKSNIYASHIKLAIFSYFSKKI